MTPTYLAAFDPEILAPLILGVGVFVVLPVVVLLLKHQRAMAELLHRNEGADASREERLRHMEAELAVIKDRLNTQILSNEPERAGLESRVGNETQTR